MENKPDNKEIIEEITKGIVETNINSSSSESKINNQSCETEKDEKFYDAEEELESDSCQSNIPNNDGLEDDEYYIDEMVLKERDSKLTPEELKNLKTEAETIKNKGNTCFKNLNFQEAIEIYTEALKMCPLSFQKERAILYANRAAARFKISEDKQLSISDCTKAIELDDKYVRAYLRRAHFYEETDKLDEALVDYKKVLEIDPSHKESICAITKLEPMIAEKNEKLKAEMLEKLKDLGNVILKPFGLSTNNFQMQKDEKTGSYSINFKQNQS